MADEKKALINGGAKLKKENPLEKFLGSFFATDSKNIKDYIFEDVFIPLVKRGITGTIDMLLYGRSRGNWNDNGGSYYNLGKNNTNYTSFYTSSNNQSRHQQPPTRRETNTSGYRNIIFETRGDAEVVLRGLQEAIEQFGIVAVSDMYEMANVPNDNFTLNHYGWTNLDGCTVIRDGGGYIIDLPRPSPIQ